MTSNSDYEPPKVWTWKSKNGGTFADINRPIAGATHDKQLPVGKHPFQLYSLATPNGVKVTVMLEELLQMGADDAEHDAWLIKIRDGFICGVQTAFRLEQMVSSSFIHETNVNCVVKKYSA